MKRVFVFVGLATLLFSGALRADDGKGMGKHKGKMEMTSEQRNKMADMHEKMAACLRSTKPMGECHEEMKNSCKDMGEACPMMGKMHGHHMMHDDDKGESDHK